MTATEWMIDSNQSDILLRARHSINAYLANNINRLKGSIAIINDALEDASVEFSIDIHSKEAKLEQGNKDLESNGFSGSNPLPSIRFQSTSFQKVSSNINFLKGNLTINNVTKVVELDAVLTHLETKSNGSKALFEIMGKINRKDFGLSKDAFNGLDDVAIGRDINLIANLEFSTIQTN